MPSAGVRKTRSWVEQAVTTVESRSPFGIQFEVLMAAQILGPLLGAEPMRTGLVRSVLAWARNAEPATELQFASHEGSSARSGSTSRP